MLKVVYVFTDDDTTIVAVGGRTWQQGRGIQRCCHSRLMIGWAGHFL